MQAARPEWVAAGSGSGSVSEHAPIAAEQRGEIRRVTR
jgi:hypothetical protein